MAHAPRFWFTLIKPLGAQTFHALLVTSRS